MLIFTSRLLANVQDTDVESVNVLELTRPMLDGECL